MTGIHNVTDGVDILAINDLCRGWGFGDWGEGGSEYGAQLGHMKCGVYL